MSVIGAVIVYRCDGNGCDAVKCVNTEDGFTDFLASWFAGESHNFCPACRGKIGNQAAIAAEESAWQKPHHRLFRQIHGKLHWALIGHLETPQPDAEVANV